MPLQALNDDSENISVCTTEVGEHNLQVLIKQKCVQHNFNKLLLL